MGKPRMIILIRHGQSEGNKNREIHQFIPDHRVKLTPQGQEQAEDAGRRLRSLLKPDDNVIFFTSPYRRTRETTEGILKTLTQDEPEPSPFPRHQIKVYEEPRLREQDFGNFQPCSAEMERMWQERADYGHFFYRIPNGESAADAYDRVSGFNESLWRQFGEADFPSVCVLVTHGLMTRVFLMKWYHWSVEYFEDLRNVNHCEFVVMKQNVNGKYRLESELRTWSDLKKRAAVINGNGDTNKHRQDSIKPTQVDRAASPSIPTRRWGGCASGCNHAHQNYPRRTRRQNTSDFPKETPTIPRSEIPDNPLAPKNPAETGSVKLAAEPLHASTTKNVRCADASNEDSPRLTGVDDSDVFSYEGENGPRRPSHHFLKVGRDFGGSHSGVGTPAEGLSDDSDAAPAYFDAAFKTLSTKLPARSSSKSSGRLRQRQGSIKSVQEWEKESGMGSGKMADRLGDDEVDGVASEGMVSGGVIVGRNGAEEAEPRRGDAMKQAMAIADGEEAPKGGTVDSLVETMKERDRKTFREVY